MKQFLNKVFIILRKDILSELRSKDIATSVLVFALLVIVIFNFTFEPGDITMVTSGVLWVAFTFAGMLALSRSFVVEKDKGCLDGLMLCPIDRDVIYIGKMLANLTFMLMVEAIILPVFSLLFNLSFSIPKMAVIAVLATIGFTSVGTLFSALAVHTKAREIMLPILFLPVVSPVIISAVKASGIVIQGGIWSDLLPWLPVMIAFDIIFLIVSSLVFEFVLEE